MPVEKHARENPAPSKRRIVIVEDDQDLIEVLRDLLEAEGYLVTVAESAFGAKSLVERVQPSAILLDLSLPYRSGVSLLRDLKATPATASIPLIVVSAAVNLLSGSERAMVTAILAKPFDTQELLDILQRWATG